jgi:imidazolonepropionase-like amidohydrolase
MSTEGSARDALTIVRADRIVDVLAGEVLTGHEVVIRGDRVEELRPKGGPASSDASVIELPDRTLTPGLIDCHAHMVGECESNAGYSVLVARSPAQEAFTGVRNARDTLMAGFTSVRDVGTFRAFVDVDLRAAIDGGWVVGPRMRCAGAYVTSSTGGGDIPGLAVDVDERVPRDLRFGVANSVDEVRKAVREILHRGADHIKVIATGAVMTEGTNPGAPEFSEAEIAAAVEEAALYDASVAAHAHGALGIKRAIRAGVRSVEHASLIDDEGIALAAERGSYLVMDIYCGDWIAEEGLRSGWPQDTLRKNDETTDAQREGFRKAVAAGVKVAYGTDSGIYPHRWVGRQMPYMVRHGMSPMQGLQAATAVAAELIGWDEIGAIAPGRYADLIAVEGDPLADGLQAMTEVDFVMKGGTVFKQSGRPVVA